MYGCITHHDACTCREEYFKATVQEWRDKVTALELQKGELEDQIGQAYAAMGNFLHEAFGWEKKQEGGYRYAFTIRKFIEVINNKFEETNRLNGEMQRYLERFLAAAPEENYQEILCDLSREVLAYFGACSNCEAFASNCPWKEGEHTRRCCQDCNHRTLAERPKGPCNCYAIEGRAHLTDCPQYVKRVDPQQKCGAEHAAGGAVCSLERGHDGRHKWYGPEGLVTWYEFRG